MVASYEFCLHFTISAIIGQVFVFPSHRCEDAIGVRGNFINVGHHRHCGDDVSVCGNLKKWETVRRSPRPDGLAMTQIKDSRLRKRRQSHKHSTITVTCECYSFSVTIAASSSARPSSHDPAKSSILPLSHNAASRGSTGSFAVVPMSQRNASSSTLLLPKMS